MFDKFTMYADRADFSRVPSPIELNNKEYLIKHPPQYFPKVSYCSGSYFGNSFKIEVSIPKIIYGNNFFETQENDFEEFLDKLTIQLGKMGFKLVDKSMLRYNQSIYNIEIAKNCILGNIPTSVVLENLYKSKPPRPQMKLVGKDWIPGEQVRFIGASHEITFYDKYLELVMAKRNQFNLDWLFQRSDLKNILRMEIRLKKEQIKQIFSDRPTLEEMFKERYYHKAVQKYFGPIATYLLAHQPYVSPDTELLLYKDAEMNASKMKDLFLVKSLINKHGYIYAKKRIKDLFGDKETNRIFSLLKRYPPMNVVQPEYNFLPMLAEQINQPKWFTPVNMGSLVVTNIKYQDFLESSLWDCKKSAKYLGVGPREIQRRCKNKEIPSIVIAGSYRIHKADVMAYSYREQQKKGT